jgi:hypothetical protein
MLTPPSTQRSPGGRQRRGRLSLQRRLLALLALAGVAVVAVLVFASSAALALPGARAGAAPLRLGAVGRRLLAQLEGTLAFNLGRASTTTKFKAVPKGQGGKSASGGGGSDGGGGRGNGAAAAAARDAATANNNTCALALSREDAGKLGQALLELASKGGAGELVQVGDVAVQVGVAPTAAAALSSAPAGVSASAGAAAG